MKRRKKSSFFMTKVGRAVAILIAVIMVVSLAIPAFAEESTTGKTTYMYMTEPGVVEFSAIAEASLKPEHLEWYLGDKKIAEWKKWSMETGDFTAEAYINLDGEPAVKEGKLTATFKYDLLFDTTDLSQRRPKNIRLAYPKMIGDYDLKAVDKETGKEYVQKITLRPYPSYMNYEEMLKQVQRIKSTGGRNRYVSVEEYGTTVQGRPMYFGIVAKNKEEIDRYLNETTPMMLNKPGEFLALLENKKADYKQVILMNNIHPDEQPAVDAVVELFNTFATKDRVTYKTTNEKGKELNETIDINKALDDLIFIFSFTMNPDGRVANTRTNANGFDLNRDNGYQTQPETRAISQVTVKYHPTLFMDYHGFVSEFLIEPCTPPHEPNYETDLLLPMMLENAHRMGRAGVASSKYDSYLIPMIDWETGWDDATSAYTPMFAMFHGSLGHTIEIPEMNEESYKAALGTGFAAVDYVLSDPDSFMKNKVQYFYRGVNKVDDRKADQYLINSKKEVIGRPRGDQENFFPDYYVIPMTADTQKNKVAAYKMAEYLKRNGVRLSQLKEDTESYHKGDLVIDMAQAKRGFINHVMYKGVNESEWAEMYAEIVVNMPMMRGFDAIEIRSKDLFQDKLTDYVMQKPLSSEMKEAGGYIIRNNSNETVRAVNDAVASGKTVEFISGQGFAVDKDTLSQLKNKFTLNFVTNENNLKGKTLKKPSLYIEGSSALKLAMKSLGFESTEKVEDAAIIVTDSASLDPEQIGTKPMIVLGGQAATVVAESGKVEGLTIGTTDFYHEGLLKGEISGGMLSTGYAKDDILYSVSGSWIETMPASFQKIASVQNSNNFFIAGWWPGNQKVRGKTMVISGRVSGQPMVIFAGNPTNKLHPEHLYRWISNAIYMVE